MSDREVRRRKRQSERERLLRERRLTYTVREVAILLDIGINKAYEWAQKGIIPTVRPDKRVIVPRVASRRCSPARRVSDARRRLFPTNVAPVANERAASTEQH